MEVTLFRNSKSIGCACIRHDLNISVIKSLERIALNEVLDIALINPN